MNTTVQKWGNSLATRIPAPFATQLHLKQNSEISIKIQDDCLIIKPVKRQKYTLDELINSIPKDGGHSEFNTGATVGKEFF